MVLSINAVLGKYYGSSELEMPLLGKPKMTNQNQTDTNEIAPTETKYQTDFYSAEKIPIFNQILSRPYSRFRQNSKKIPRNLGQKYQIPILYWYFLGIPNFWLPIGITTLNPAGK